MVSYAPQAGGIGPHVDNYDVFLLQGRGTRRWSIQNVLLSPQDEQAGLIENSPVRVLRDFQEDYGWVLEPGDMLYLPPRVPHNGVSQDKDCMTYSVGFRAPTQKELVQAAATAAVQAAAAVAAAGAGEVFYSDPDLSLTAAAGEEGRDAGEITPAALRQLKALVQDGLAPILDDERALAGWLGRHLTTPKRARLDEDYPPRMGREEAEAVVQRLLSDEVAVYRAEGLKFAHASKHRLLFVDGHMWELKTPEEGLRRRMCACLSSGPSPLPTHELRDLLAMRNDEFMAMVTAWLEQGVLYVLDGGEEEDGGG